jgi:hypothetical protein
VLETDELAEEELGERGVLAVAGSKPSGFNQEAEQPL